VHRIIGTMLHCLFLKCIELGLGFFDGNMWKTFPEYVEDEQSSPSKFVLRFPAMPSSCVCLEERNL
jgi:hypothetical protein